MIYRQTDPWLEWWKARAEYNLTRLDRILSREPISQRQAWRRKLFMEHALKSVERGRTWTDARSQFLGELHDVLQRAAPPINETGVKGDLGG